MPLSLSERNEAVPDIHDSVADCHMSSPSLHRTGHNKRKKGKPNIKKQQAIKKKLQSLSKNLNPVAFMPPKIPDFSKHEVLLKKLGLWEFVHLDFDRNIRKDLIAQLVATYDPRLRASYVNECRILVNRADLGRALKLPIKKEKEKGSLEVVDLDSGLLSDERSIGFIQDLVSDWMLLHEDAWPMPNEVLNWMNMIKEGHPERVDWASLFWFMVDKELLQGEQLRDCYYASHFQYLIKSQREDLLLFREESASEKAESKEEENTVKVAREEDITVKEVDVEADRVDEGAAADFSLTEGPCFELTLGQEVGKKEKGVKDAEMIDVDKRGNEVRKEEQQGKWLLGGRKNVGEHFMQQCNMEEGTANYSFEDRKEDEEEMEEGEEAEEEGGEETEDGYDVLPDKSALEGDGLTGNLLQAMEKNEMAFGSQDQLHDSASMDLRADMLHMAPGPSIFNNTGKRVDHENDISQHTLNESNKRLRINDSWNQKPVDFGTYVVQIQQLVESTRMMYEEKEQALDQSNMNQQILLNELQKRDGVIEHLQNQVEQMQMKDGEIYRLERELCLMKSIVDGYRKALKDTQKAFAAYREKAQLPEEPVYRDAGPGGLMLSVGEIEKLRQRQEEEYKMNCAILEQKVKEVQEDYASQFQYYCEKINILDEKLKGLETDAKELPELYAKRKALQTEENVPKVSEPGLVKENGPQVSEPGLIEENAPEFAEFLLPNEEEVPEVSEPPLPNEEKVPEISEPPLPSDEKVPEVSEPPLPNEERAPEVLKPPLPIEEKVPEVLKPPLPNQEEVPEVAELNLPNEEKVPEVAAFYLPNEENS